MLKKLLQEIDIANRRYRLLKRGDRVVAAVSGGPDSMALLWLLSKLQRKYQLKIIVAHLNHGLLKKQSQKHLSLVKETAKALNLPFSAKKIDLKTLAKKNKRSLEEMGRMERYRFFEDVARKFGANKIATAHTLDDQAETMLLRILRGSGLRGLVGIPCKRKQGGQEVVRPLLFSEKKELLLFLKQNGLRFALDRSNQNVRFTRNRVRHELLPKLAELFNPQIKHTLANLQEISQETQDHLEKVSRRALAGCLVKRRSGKKRVSLELSQLKRLHPAVLREVLFQALLAKRGDLKRLGYSHIAGIIDMIHSPEEFLEQHLPGPLIVKKGQGTLDLIDTRSK